MLLRIPFTVLFFMLCAFSNAQNSGKIIYDEVMVFDIKVPENLENRDEIIAKMPKDRRSKKEIIFNKDAALYRTHETGEEEEEEFGGRRGRGWRMRMGGSSDLKTFWNREENRLVEQRSFMGKDFLIKDEVEKQAWKITGEMSRIQGYTCMKATIEDTTGIKTAWFTPEIPVGVGPYLFGEFPGAVLKYEDTGRKWSVTATAVDLETEINTSELEEPTKGKEITRKEFRAMMKKKRKEMREMYGKKSGGFRMEIRQ